MTESTYECNLLLKNWIILCSVQWSKKKIMLFHQQKAWLKQMKDALQQLRSVLCTDDMQRTSDINT